ncbi:MAG: hypothetical protein KA015_01115 [Spirochaetes bacterium]|nr:hypothetical protein [Spirochaetota bacterium]
MANISNPQLCTLVDHSSPDAVFEEVKEIFSYHYDLKTFQMVERSFVIIKSLFEGQFEGYQKCNTEYHDLNHTLDALLAAARLMDGFNISSETILSEESTVALLLAVIYHDSGYIQRSDDTFGTGAKYTKNHVERSTEFVISNKDKIGITALMSDVVSSLIRWTGLRNDMPGESVMGKDYTTAGSIIGTADLLGQMSDRAYLEKLLFLYYEFKEAEIEGFNTEFDILRKTLSFYSTTQDRLDRQLGKVYNFAKIHFNKRFGIPFNLYMEAIEKQMHYLKNVIDDESVNFRHKLKRMDVETIEQRYLY